MEAGTITIANTMFPVNTEIRLNSREGSLNLGPAVRPFAVNFTTNVGVMTPNGTGAPVPSLLVDSSGIANTANVSSLVWIGNNTANNKVFINNAAPQTPVVTQPNSMSAPIHIQTVGSAAVPGINHVR